MLYLRLRGGFVVIALSIVLITLQLVEHAQAGTFFPLNLLKFKAQGQVPIKDVEYFGYIEYKPNGTLILRSTMENGTNLQNLLLFKSVLSAIKVAKLIARDDNANATQQTDGIKMYGDGVEHKFPPFLERILQRIQTYFSIYKYTDTSQPLPLQNQQQQQNDVNNITNIFNTNNDTLEFDADIGDTDTVGGGNGGGGILQSTTNIINMNTIAPTTKYSEFIAIENSSSNVKTSKD